MNYLFTICGRAGSKGLENKNVSDFNGIPLVYYTLAAIKLVIERLNEAGHKCEVVLNTDSEELVRIVNNQSKLPVLHIEREEKLAGDRVAKVTVIKDTLLKSQKHWEIEFDYVIDLDITSPLRTVKNVMDAIRKKEENKQADVVYSLSKARKNPYFNMAKRVGNFYEKVIHAKYISRQETPEVFDMNASIYVYEPKALICKEASTFFNSKADAIIMKDTAVLDIDCEEDKNLMEILAHYYFFEKFDDYKEVYKYAKVLGV
ncbi:MAG: acylneuraminate cytidylyltransferase family protein [Lachnospiraceae bacterium]|nr:acylneuraminate cytidylyltransferase family protein [Lachnospiraceae bacterium]